MIRPVTVLVHWKEAETRERIERLEKAGYRVRWHGEEGAGVCKAVGKNPPDAVVIDLSRLPSHGRETALELRRRAKTRKIPLVFVEGDREKVARIHRLLPDAVYTTWRSIRSALAGALAHPPEDPVVPKPYMEGYSGKTLAAKLGIGEDMTVCMVDAPDGLVEDFEATFGPLPDGVTLRDSDRGNRDLTVCFLRDRKDLERRLDKMVERADQGPVWTAWPKKSSSLDSDLSQPVVQKAFLEAGLVDSKICAVDDTWSALRFTHRRR